MTNIGTTYLSFQPLVSRIPDAKVLAIGLIDFTLDSLYVIDLTATIQSAQLANQIQAIYCDCSSVLYSSTEIEISGTGQRIVVPPSTQGYYPILCSQTSFIFSISNMTPPSAGAGTSSFYIYFMNVPYVASQWSTLAPGASIAGGYGTGGLGNNPLGS